ncbi:glycosyltransferase family protein [Aeromicrobium endophyticum]|uniref:Glycosyltransferase n=1 Tax=Aeromicrobium endophyticum TaxID=2292704 RepID=A0A371PDZ7_9ACTN|nr:glycosyltransferase [Aeromicrobium endophyticum]REK73866.1 glycosyltransferase [Aeromicrobium endophyticum]
MSPSPKSRLRGVARKAREVVATDDGADGGLDVRRVLASGLFDPWYYALQTRVEQEPAAALEHYVRHGAAAGMLPNPLTDVDATGLTHDQVVAAVLDGSARAWPSREILDDLELVALAPAAADHPGGPVGFYLQHARAGAPVPQLGKWTWKRFVHLRTQQSAAVATILAAAVLDRAYYEAQAGRTFVDDRSAVWHFLETGESQALTLSPLYERAWYRSKAGVRMPMTFVHLLRTGQVEGVAGPHFDGATYLALVPQAAEHPGGPLGHFLEHADARTQTVPEPGSGIEPTTWGDLRERLLGTAVETGRQQALLRPPPTTVARWSLASARPPAPGDDAGAVAIVADAAEWGRGLPDTLATVLAQEHVPWTLRVAVAADVLDGSALHDLAGDPRVVLVPTRETTWAGRAGAVLATVDEPWTIAWQASESWSPGLLGGLLAQAQPGVLTHAAAVDEDAGRWWTELPARDSLLWDAPRPLSGVLAPTDDLRRVGVRSEADDRWDWDVLLRHDLATRFVPFVGVRGSRLGQRPLAPGRASTHEHAARAADLVDWEGVRGEVGRRVRDRVSVLVVSHGDRHRTRRAVDRVLEHADRDVEVVVVDNGSAREVSSVLASCFASDARVSVLRIASSVNESSVLGRAFAASTGEVVVMVGHDTEVHEGWLAPLVEAVGADDVLAAQPLLLTADDTIRSAGWMSAGPQVVPVPLLASHPVVDLPEPMPAPDAVSAAGLAVRAEVLASVDGLDPTFDDLADVDLCLRLADRRAGRFATVTASRISRRARSPLGEASEPDQLRLLDRWGGRLPAVRPDAWQRTGLTLAGFAPGPGLPESRRRTTSAPVLARPARLVEDGPAAGLPRLRWAVKIAAQGGPHGDVWGDTYFADDLVRSLRAWGQEAFVDRRGAHQRPGVDHLDDVTLTLRGRWPAVAQPGATNVLWVISHPDEVPVDELRQGFDLVYSAGRAWADQASAETGREVRTLLQATDAGRFTPEGEAMPGVGTLFVGRTRKVMRPVVGDAAAAGADLTVFGDGWEQFIDPTHVAADHLDNERVPAAYRGARIVLNDHWPDMARLGFYSNRLFDAVAAGARVVSDRADGLEDVLGPSARTYGSLDELRALLDPGSSLWPGADVLASNAARVAAQHSFDARARVLLADVLDARGVTHDL